MIFLFENALGQLVHVVGERIISGTNAIGFIPKTKVSRNKKNAYGRLVCDICPRKKEHIGQGSLWVDTG